MVSIPRLNVLFCPFSRYFKSKRFKSHRIPQSSPGQAISTRFSRTKYTKFHYSYTGTELIIAPKNHNMPIKLPPLIFPFRLRENCQQTNWIAHKNARRLTSSKTKHPCIISTSTCISNYPNNYMARDAMDQVATKSSLTSMKRT